MKTQYNSVKDLIDELDRDLTDFTTDEIEIAERYTIAKRQACKCLCDNCLCVE